MTETALEQGGNADDSSGWVRRTLLVTFCLGLLGTLGVVFTRVVAARVPEQRATLEKLITDRTGFALRFDNVHFAWTLDGTSAVFERVELTDPVHGRVRVVAPELRVEFDTWDYLRHHQFSLGHVTLSSPDIEIIGEPVEATAATARSPRVNGKASALAQEDEATLVRHLADWVELMPNGRVEVEGARVHLRRRGDRAARNTFTLSQAVVIRGASNFSAFGTMLLSQDVGQSLFLSAKLSGLGGRSGISGDLRVIARRVFLDKLPLIDAKGRGTLDASLRLQDGLVQAATWQASAREIEFDDDAHTRFDHFTVNGKLERNAGDFLLQFADLQLTRGARLERAPKLSARVTVTSGTTHIERTTLAAERMPFMAAEFLTRLLAPQLEGQIIGVPGDWVPTGGELRAVRFDSGRKPGDWNFEAELTGADVERTTDRTRISSLAASLQIGARGLSIEFDPATTASVRTAGAHVPRSLNLGGRLMLLNPAAAVRFEDFTVRSDTSTLAARGEWNGEQSLALTVTNIDRALLLDGWSLLGRDAESTSLLADIEQGVVVDGTLNLIPLRDSDGRAVNWQRSNGVLKLAGLASSGKDMPLISSGRGTLEFSRGHTKLLLDGGEVDQLAVTSARLDWPRTGAPRLHAALQGDLSSPVLRRVLKAQGLERLTGRVALEADARGEKELRQPDLWRLSAKLADASLALGGGLPPVEKISGTVRYGAGQLRGLTLEGRWLGGPVEIESRRATSRGNSGSGMVSFAINGVADAAPLLRLLGKSDAANRIDGELSWTGTAQRLDDGKGTDSWQVSLASTLAGIESRLPEPFEKPKSRTLPVSAQLRVNADGIQNFEIESGRDASVRGVVENGVTTARFDVQGVTGELRRAGNSSEPKIQIGRLDMKRSPALLAAAAAMLPPDDELALAIKDLRYAGRSLGAVQATLARHESGVAFSLESSQAAPHQLAARGQCGNAEARCRLEFTANTEHLAALLRDIQLPSEWPTETLHAAGELSWPAELPGELAQSLTGQFELETQGRDSSHQMIASATLAEGQIALANVQGTGPEADQMFRGTGRVALLARQYDLTVDYERVSMAASAVPTQARARVARAWTALRGSVARRGWAEAPEARRVQWHGTWDAEQ
ncbi:MAG TPA: DUF3971 domain-containing protein [Steroidobacteraceae bacterium]|nr:DUF3971 domain-containing protein [Steroidobacteraceae bacterium]